MSRMTLEDFEKSLAQEKESRKSTKRERDHRNGEEHRHRHHHRHHDSRDEHRHKRRRSKDHGRHSQERQHKHHRHSVEEPSDESQQEGVDSEKLEVTRSDRPQRDSWMENPSSLDIDYVQKPKQDAPKPASKSSSKKDFELKIHDKELNKHHLQDVAEGREILEDPAHLPGEHEINYTFGDSGAQWRMTKLKAVYRRAEEEGRDIEDVAAEQFGNLHSFDDAREEEIELDRRATYGSEYVGKEKPSGELFKEREHNARLRKEQPLADRNGHGFSSLSMAVETLPTPAVTAPIDQTSLNRLKAQMMKAKIRGGPEAERLEAEYSEALAGFANPKQPDVIVLGAMENRMLAGGDRGEVKAVENRRGRERGLVVENEDMSIEDMVREERRTRGQAGGDGLRLAERIAKDGKFDNDLEYMDENAAKLAKRVHKSEMNLKNTAISDFQKMNRILDTCPLCHHEDTDKPPMAPVVSLATRVYLTLPTEPEISDGGAFIVPIQHRSNLLECDDDEWEEIRNFMKSLTRMYHDQGRSVLFYENAAAPQKRRHAGMEAVPIPYSLGDLAPQFFKEAILASDEEWTQHKKIIDTLARAKDGLGKLAFRRTLVKEMPYFHVWFEIDGGLGHIVEDSNRWPKGDLFAREILGGMMDKGPEVVKKQGRWRRDDGRVEGFRKRWRKFDWTRILTDS